MKLRIQSTRISLTGPAKQIVPLAELAFGLEGDIAPLVNTFHKKGDYRWITGMDYSDSDNEMCSVLIERI